MSDSFATLWTVAVQSPLSMEFSGQEYWSGLTCPPPGDLPSPGIEPMSPASPARQAGIFLPTEPPSLERGGQGEKSLKAHAAKEGK